LVDFWWKKLERSEDLVWRRHRTIEDYWENERERHAIDWADIENEETEGSEERRTQESSGRKRIEGQINGIKV